MKARCRLSDRELIEQLNENKMMQYFCGINLKPAQQIKDAGVVSRWRLLLGQYLNAPALLVKLQSCNVQAWKEHLEDRQINLADATCYESYVRYPTDVKLLWESIDYLHGQIKLICNYVGIARPRTKFKEQKKKYLAYQKSRRKTYKKTRAVKRRLLYLLNKYLQLLPSLIGGMLSSKHLMKLPIKTNFFDRIKVIKKVYKQQQLHFDHPKTKIENRIVSLAKPYLHPIVRGKEIKRVEFGMKVHEMHAGGWH